MKKFPCYQKKYQIKKFYCINEFFLSFRENPFQQCVEKVKELGTCRRAIEDDCLSLASKNGMIYSIYVNVSKPSTHKELRKDYCRNAGLMTKYLSEKAMARTGCKIDYYHGKELCIKKFQRKWRHNRSSVLLCSEYYKMEKCINNELMAHCSKQAVITLQRFGKDVLSKLSVDSNPFCVYKRKPL